MKYDIVALYVCIDNFSKIYEKRKQKKLIGATKIERENRPLLKLIEQFPYYGLLILN